MKKLLIVLSILAVAGISYATNRNFTASGVPSFNAPASSATLRNEFAAVSTGFGSFEAAFDNRSTVVQSQLNLKSPLASPTFTGTVTIPTPFTLGAVSVLPTGTELNFVDGVTSAIQTQLDTKAPLASPTFTGTVTIPTPFTLGAVSVLPTGTELNYVDGVTSAIQTQMDAKAPLASPTFTGTVDGITKAMVGLTNVDDTADAEKPVSTAQQTALDLKVDTSAVTSGTYTPTYAITDNLDSVTADGLVRWYRIGNIVSVSGSVQVNATLGSSSATQLTISLPVASTFTLATDASGVGLSTGSPVDAPCTIVAASNKVNLAWFSTVTSAQTKYFTFTYLVK